MIPVLKMALPMIACCQLAALYDTSSCFFNSEPLLFGIGGRALSAWI